VLTRKTETPNVAAKVSGAVSDQNALAESRHANFKTEMGRISRQSSIAFAGTIFTAIVGYGFKIYLARFLGADALGLYALGITIISFLGIVNILGIPESAVRFVAEYSAGKKIPQLRALLWNGSWILVATNLVFGAVLLKVGPWIALHVYHAPQLERYLPLFAGVMFLSALNHFYGNVMTGYREAGRRNIISKFIASPTSIAATVLLVTFGYGLGGYLVAQVLSAFCILALLVYWVWRLTPREARSLDLHRLGMGREVWVFSAAMFGIGLMQFLMVQTDRVVLGMYRGARDVGIYSVVVSMIAYETIFLQSVNQIFAPVIADIHARSEREVLSRLFQTLTKWILGLTLPLATVVILYAPAIMRMFGKDFEAGWPALVVGTFGQLVNCGVGSVGFLLLMSGHERRLVRVQMVMATVMVILCFNLVPRWGALGAAAAAAITNAGMNLLNLIEVRRALKLSPYNWSYLKLLPPVGGAALVVLLLRRSSTFGGAQLLAAATALVLAYMVFGIVAFWTGLDADDRLITNAIATRLRSTFSKTRSGS